MKLPQLGAWSVLTVALAYTLPTTTTRAQSWPQFRGPDGTSVIPGAALATEWSTETNIAWKIEVPGTGWSSPVVAGDRVFVTAAQFENQPRPSGFRRGVSSMRSYREDSRKLMTDTQFLVHCYRLSDGEKLWSRTLAERVPAFTIHPSNTYATGSPVTNGNAVFTHFAAAGVVAAYDLEGELLWKKDLGAFPAGNGFGAGSSLSIGEGLVFLQCDNDEASFALALDPKSGDEVWRLDRDSRTSWSTPLLWRNRARTELVLCGSGTVTGVEPATGETIWELEGFGGSFSSTPASDADQLYFGNSGPGSAGPLTTVVAGAEGEVPYQQGQPSKWSPWARTGSGPGLASPVAHDGFLYVVAGSGILSCYNVETGERLYQERLPKGGSVASSLWIANGELYALDELGTTHVLALGPNFEVLRQNRIEDLFWSTPAVLSDTLLLRGADFLYCVREDSKS